MSGASFRVVNPATVEKLASNKGEICSASSRLVVDKRVHDDFVAKLSAKAKAMRVGDPFDPKSEMGAQVSTKQLERILGYVKSGVADDATVACGGERDTDGTKAKGAFMKPTIFTGVKPTMTIAQEEIFGPVLSVIPFESDAEAATIANGSVYGLAASIWTRDAGRALGLARQVRSGVVWVNLATTLLAATTSRLSRLEWATLLKRIYDVDALKCPRCDRCLDFIAVLTEPTAIRAILEHLDLPSSLPILAHRHPIARPFSFPENRVW